MGLGLLALVVISVTLLLGIIVGYLVPGKERKGKWYAILTAIGGGLSLLFALGAYVFTESSLFHFASTRVGVFTFSTSFVTFAVLISTFVIGLWVGDVLEMRLRH